MSLRAVCRRSVRGEGVNKIYGTTVILAEETHTLARSVIEARELDTVVVAGKTESVRIFELLGRTDSVVVKTLEIRGLYAEGLGGLSSAGLGHGRASLQRSGRRVPGRPASSRLGRGVAARGKVSSGGPLPAAWRIAYTLGKQSPPMKGATP